MPLWFKKFLLFGDSITQFAHSQAGFALAPALQDLYQRKMDIVTRGFSGYNSNQATVVLREVLRADNAALGDIRLMTLFFGTNDASSMFQGMPLPRYSANLREMVALAQSYGIKVVLVGPALHDAELCKQARGDLHEPQPWSSSRATRAYADAAKAVAAEFGVPFVDLWDAFQRYGGYATADLLAGSVDLEELLPDGIHFSPRAYEIFYDELVETIVTHYPELAPASLDMVFPYYRDIDYENNEKCLMESLGK